MPTTRLQGYGISVELPNGWEGRIYRREDGNPILHAANFALPARDGDFASGAAAAMGDEGILMVLAEYTSDLAGLGLFHPRGLPRSFRGSDASPKTMQRMLRGRSGIQRFFTEMGRPFTLYVVVGSQPSVGRLVAGANDVLASLVIAPVVGRVRI